MKIKVNHDGTLQNIGKPKYDYILQFEDTGKTFHKLRDALDMTQRILYGFGIPHSVRSIKKALKDSGAWENPEVGLILTKQIQEKCIL